jgi:hypothetical protein
LPVDFFELDALEELEDEHAASAVANTTVATVTRPSRVRIGSP